MNTLSEEVSVKLVMEFDPIMDTEILDAKVKKIIAGFDTLSLAMIKSCKIVKTIAEVEINVE